MNKFLLLLYVLLSILSFTFAQEDPGRNKPALMKELPTQEITTLVDNLMNDYMKQDLFSGAVLVAKDREPVYLKAFGKADSENDRDNRTDTKFDIGSINKDFTSVAILQLVGKGKLKLDDNIGKYLNQFPKEVLDKVTIRQLLTHTSGFGDYFMIPGVIQKLKDLTTIDKIINTFKDQPLLFEPGTDREYSNAGYAVLGAVIESVSGMSYFDYIDKNILKPANLSNTYFDYRTIRNDNEIPAGYMFSSTGKRIRVDYEKTPSPAGSGFSTVEDLLKFQLSLLYDNKLLGDNMKVLLASEFKNESGKNWRDILADSAYISALAGGAPGRNSVIYCQPVSGYIIIVLANYDEPVAEDVGRNIYRLLAGKEIIKPVPGVFQKLYTVYIENGSEYLKNNFYEIISGYPSQEDDDFLLNRIGYDLLREENLKEAIEIFGINTELFPDIANTWDSFAEVYAANGQKELAIKYYKKAIEVNPDSPAAQNSKEMLKKLEADN